MYKSYRGRGKKHIDYWSENVLGHCERYFYTCWFEREYKKTCLLSESLFKDCKNQFKRFNSWRTCHTGWQFISVFNNQFLMYCRAPGIFFHSRHLNKTTSECPSVSSYGSIIVKQTVTLSLIYYVQHCFPYCSKHLFKLNCVWYVYIYIYVYIYVFIYCMLHYNVCVSCMYCHIYVGLMAMICCTVIINWVLVLFFEININCLLGVVFLFSNKDKQSSSFFLLFIFFAKNLIAPAWAF